MEKSRKKGKMNLTNILRRCVQLLLFLLYPGLFLSVFQALKSVVQSVLQGDFMLTDQAGNLILLILIFGITILWGRFFCGYVCAFGTMQDVMYFLAGLVRKKRKSIPNKMDLFLKYMKYMVLVFIVAGIWILQLPVDSSFSPWGVFGMLVSGNMTSVKQAIPTAGFVLLLLIAAGAVFVQRFFCRYLCPLGALFTITSAGRRFRIRKSEACVSCRLCDRTCSMGIPVSEDRMVRSGECIDCMQCLESCPKAALSSTARPAIAGSLTALSMCGLISVGRLAVNQLEERDDTSIVIEQEGSLKDGKYTGRGEGFRGAVETEVTVENGNITEIQILSYQDDSEYFDKAKKELIREILLRQSVEVPFVSGATFSSKGILESVRNALIDAGLEQIEATTEETTQAKEVTTQEQTTQEQTIQEVTGQEETEAKNGEESEKETEEETESEKETGEETEEETESEEETGEEAEEEAESESGLADGTYTGYGTGFRGTTVVEVEVEDGRIIDITVESYQDDDRFFLNAKSGIISEILDAQSLYVSNVSGATYSSNSILEAVSDAIGWDYSPTEPRGRH